MTENYSKCDNDDGDDENADNLDDDFKPTTFESMGLDSRLLHAIIDLGWQKPTLIQEKAIPLALEGLLFITNQL